jgi:hypothetical protein
MELSETVEKLRQALVADDQAAGLDAVMALVTRAMTDLHRIATALEKGVDRR